ncbi:cytochrome P450 87A3, partial [Jatropha curcas]
MWIIGLCFASLLVIYCTHFFYKWRNPKCKGVLPPGSMGLPIIGETLQLIIPSYSLDHHPFIQKRIQRYGPIFRTNLVGRPVIVSADPEVNQYIFQQEGNSVEMWYLDAYAKIFQLDGESRLSAVGRVHKYIRSITLNNFGIENLKENLLPQIQDLVNQSLQKWSNKASVDVKQAASVMVFNLTAKQMFSYGVEKNSSEEMTEKFTGIFNSLMSLPLNIPGTTYHKCLKDREAMLKMLRDTLKQRLSSPDTHRGDFLDQAIDDMDTEKFLTGDCIPQLIFGILLAGFETTATTLTLAFKFLAEHPLVLEELTAEHEKILSKRENLESPLTWDEYKSMTFTHHVINETLRLANFLPGLLRKALKDIQVKNYTIPAGWTIMVVKSAMQLNPEIYKDPLAFNPWRWKDLDSYTVSKNFMPFGGGSRQCAGADYSKLFMTI